MSLIFRNHLNRIVLASIKLLKTNIVHFSWCRKTSGQKSNTIVVFLKKAHQSRKEGTLLNLQKDTTVFNTSSSSNQCNQAGKYNKRHADQEEDTNFLSFGNYPCRKCQRSHKTLEAVSPFISVSRHISRTNCTPID